MSLLNKLKKNNRKENVESQNFNFMRFHKLALIFSILCIAYSVSIVAIKGLNFGIDFAGGILLEVKTNAKIEELRSTLKSNFKDVQIQQGQDSIYVIKFARYTGKEIQESEYKNVDKIKIALNQFSDLEYRKIDYVGPQIGRELIIDAILAVILSFAFIMIYMWIRFDWQFGVGGIFALIHDSFLLLGFYSISQIEFNATSIAAILTVIGYSINDSVVIYDRIRENIRIIKKSSLKELINSSINTTFSRTILTSSTTLIALFALVLMGGEALKSFAVGSFVGILIGTYSSIYISAPILLYFDPRKSSK